MDPRKLRILGLFVLVNIYHVTASSIDNNLEITKLNETVSPQLTSSYCYSNSECYTNFGINSRCYTSRCICDIGYYPSVIGGRCNKISCFWDSDCSSKQFNTRCWAGTCSCKSGTYLEFASQTCLYSNPGTKFSVGIPIGIVVFIIFVALITFCVIRQRRMRAVRTRVVLSPGSGPPAPPQHTFVAPPGTSVMYPAPGYAPPQNPYFPQQQQQQHPQGYPAPPPYNPGFQQGAPQQPNNAPPYPTGTKY